MRAPQCFRLRLVTLSLGLAVGGGSLIGCHKQAADKSAQEQASGQPAPDPEAVKQAYAGLKKQFADMQQSFADLSKDLEAIPPDLQGYPQLRATFYAAEESRGVTDAKVTMLGSRLDSALQSGKPDDLRQVSASIGATAESGRKIGETYIKLLHEVMAYQRVAAQRKQAVAASNAAAQPAKAKHAKSK